MDRETRAPLPSLPSLIDPAWLERERDGEGAGTLRVVDVRWRLGKPGEGRLAYDEERIPGAAFLDLDEDLSDRRDPRRGRHPLPSTEWLVARLAAVGVGEGDRVVAYDDAGGSAAARLWWMLRAIGAPAAVLDGGLPRWIAEQRPLERGAPASPVAAAHPMVARAPLEDPTRVVDRRAVGEIVDGRRAAVLVDARAGERYRGEVEPVDRRPGHIPGALNAPFAGNLDAAGRFLPPSELRARFAALGVTDGRDVVCYCGSGVTACHDLLALELAGLPGARLYPGSWSEWCQDDAAPTKRGAVP